MVDRDKRQQDEIIEDALEEGIERTDEAEKRRKRPPSIGEKQRRPESGEPKRRRND